MQLTILEKFPFESILTFFYPHRNGSTAEVNNKGGGNINEDEKLKEMIYFMYNYVQQKEKIDKDQSMELESDSSSPDRGCKTSTGGSDASSLVSSNSPSSLQSPGSRSSLSDNSGVSPYGLLQMVNTSFTLSYRKYCVSLYWEYSFSNKIFSIV